MTFKELEDFKLRVFNETPCTCQTVSIHPPKATGSWCAHCLIIVGINLAVGLPMGDSKGPGPTQLKLRLETGR